MIINTKNIVSCVLLLLCMHAMRLDAFIVRVCIDEGDTTCCPDNTIVTLRCKGGFIVEDYQNAKIKKSITKDTLKLTLIAGDLHINGKKYFLDCEETRNDEQKKEIHATSPYIRIKPIKEDACIGWNGNRYDGDFVCACDHDSYVLTNWLDSELYVAAVLNAESYGKWGLEVNKAFAIMCRTYLMHTLLEARSRKKKKWYDIKCTNAHQTYNGTHDCEIIWQAVAGTSHIIMGHKGKPILAMYDVCCGGVIPAYHEGINFVQEPCLARRYGCDYCSECKLYRWRATCSVANFEQRIKKELAKQYDLKGSIQSATVSKADAAGGVKEVLIKGNKGTLARVTGKQMYSWFKQIKSQVYTVKKEGDEIVFEGKGYGHHFGLCQWGARSLIRDGKSYKDTLHFYYPGITFMKIEVI